MQGLVIENISNLYKIKIKVKEQTSEITSAKSNEIQTASTPLEIFIFNNKIVKINLIINSKT